VEVEFNLARGFADVEFLEENRPRLRSRESLFEARLMHACLREAAVRPYRAGDVIAVSIAECTAFGCWPHRPTAYDNR
jgi:hypothetical protein